MVRMTRSKANENQSFHALTEKTRRKRKAVDATSSDSKKAHLEDSIDNSAITQCSSSLSTSEQVPTFDEMPNEETNYNEDATDDLNNSDIIFDDEGEVSLNEESDSPEDNEPVENNSIKKRRGRGKGVEYVFGNTFKNPLHFTGSTFYQKLREECSLKTKTSHEHGDVEIFVCKFSRKKAFEECPVKFKVVYPSNNTAVEVFVQGSVFYTENELNTP